MGQEHSDLSEGEELTMQETDEAVNYQKPKPGNSPAVPVQPPQPD